MKAIQANNPFKSWKNKMEHKKLTAKAVITLGKINFSRQKKRNKKKSNSRYVNGKKWFQ